MDRKQWADQFGVMKPYLFAILILAIIIAVILSVAPIGHKLYCVWFGPHTIVQDSDLQPMISYLRDHCWDIPEVQTMVQNWEQNKFPTVVMTPCSDGLDGCFIKFTPETIAISRGVWEAYGPDAVALKALVLFGEFQHTRLGGFQHDVQPTQDILIKVREKFPFTDQTARVKNIAHANTKNHDD